MTTERHWEKEAVTSSDRGPHRRGQTPQDYLVGVVVFIATIAVILALLPSFTTPFQSGVGGDSSAQADRVAQQLVSNLSSIDEPNLLDGSELMEVLSTNSTGLESRFGLSKGTNLNVTVETLDGSALVTNGSDVALTSSETYTGAAAASTERIVRLKNGSYECKPACRLVVRIW
jgi:hypothetical protein